MAKRKKQAQNEVIEIYNGHTPIPFYLSVQHEKQHQLELLTDIIHDEGLYFNLRVFCDKVLKEAVIIRLPHNNAGHIAIQQDFQIVFSQRFAHDPDAIRLPMVLSREQINEGVIDDPALQAIVRVAKRVPALPYLNCFIDYFPNKIVAKDGNTGVFHYADGKILEFSTMADPTLRPCTEEEIRRQENIRLMNCDKPWSDKDYYCLSFLDPCTGLPRNGEAILGCLFGGPIGCAICIFIAIILSSREAE